MTTSPQPLPHDFWYHGLNRSTSHLSTPTSLTQTLKSHLAMSVTSSAAVARASSSTSSKSNSPRNVFSNPPSTSRPAPDSDRSNSWQGMYSPLPPVSLPQPAIGDSATAMSSSATVSYSSMSDAFSMSKGTGLIRRLSRGAHNRLRRRPSTTQTNRIRDQSAGPVLVRRRSDSTGANDLTGDMSDLELERTDEEANEETLHNTSSLDPANLLPTITARKVNPSPIMEGDVAPTISSVLEQGTWLIKVTKKKRKLLKFRLDSLAAKVCWNATNPTKQFYIDDVRDIRTGPDARSFRQQDVPGVSEQDGCWMTIVYDAQERSKGQSIKTMHLIAPNGYIAKLWTDALNVVSRERIEVMNALSASVEKSERSMSITWKQATTRKNRHQDQRIDFEDAKWICRKLEINCSIDAIRAAFNQADHDLIGTLSYAQYEYFVSLFKVRKDIRSIYHSSIPAAATEMDCATFLNFLRDTQAIDVDKDLAAWENKFELYCRSAPGRAADAFPSVPSMSLQAFQNFLASGANSALVTSQFEATLDRPLNEYFISSSHNTYLLGRQVRGTSSVEGYISALTKGCRCIEIDCWDGKYGRPIVNHGRTMTSEIMFEDCIAVITRYAFASSTYPLIISLEVHCSTEQQLIMVEIMRAKFGDYLLTAPLNPNATSLPSPEELKSKILIKVKGSRQQSEGQAATDSTRRQRSFSSPFTRALLPDNSSVPSSGTPANNSPYGRSANTWSVQGSTDTGFGPGASAGSSSADDSDTAGPLVDTSKKSDKNDKSRKTSNIIAQLGELGVYACGIKYSGFSAEEAQKYNHIYSFAETTFDRFCKSPESKAQLEKHNARYLMRVYPAAIRVDSSNFNPLQSWKRGVQMAALNWQTYDIHLQMNEAMFAAGSDRTGYVLKPEEMRQAQHVPFLAEDSNAELGLKDKKAKQLVKFSVEIVSAQRLPRPRNHDPEVVMNPYIEFEMFSAEDKARGLAKGEGGTDASARDGSSGIGSPLRRRTKIVEGNGFDPTFNEPMMMMVETKYPSLIFVRWTVWNSPDGRNLSSNSTILATFTAKLSSLQQGYRHLPLFNACGERYRDAKLFVKIKRESPIPLHEDEPTSLYKQPNSNASSPRLEPVRHDSRSWPRKIFSRAPSERRKRQEIYSSSSRTSSLER